MEILKTLLLQATNIRSATVLLLDRLFYNPSNGNISVTLNDLRGHSLLCTFSNAIFWQWNNYLAFDTWYNFSYGSLAGSLGCLASRGLSAAADLFVMHVVIVLSHFICGLFLLYCRCFSIVFGYSYWLNEL